MGGVERAVFPKAAGRAAGGLEVRCTIFAREGDRVLLVRHRGHPIYEGAWTLPGDVLEYGVSPRESAARILRTQAGVVPRRMRLLGVQSSVEGDWVLTFQFEAEVEGELKPGRGIAEVRFARHDEPLGEEVHAVTRTELQKYRIHELAKTA